VPTYITQVGDVRVRVTLTGVGQRAATVAARTVFHDRPDVCIASGLAGGLNEELRVAGIVASGSVVDHCGRIVDIDPGLLSLALTGGARSVSLYSSPTIVASVGDKRRLSDIADAVDMESAAVLGESSRLGIPCIAIRAISDPSTVDLPIDLNRTMTEGRISPLRTLAALAKRPHAVRRLVRLGIDGHRAAVALVTFLDGYIEQLGDLTTSRSGWQ
jgi:adenosylhomocysteine nucleosidase